MTTKLFIYNAGIKQLAYNIWKSVPSIIFLTGIIGFFNGYKALPMLLTLPLLFQIAFRLLGVQFNLKQELLAYANPHSTIERTSYVHSTSVDHNNSINLKLENQIYIDYRD